VSFKLRVGLLSGIVLFLILLGLLYERLHRSPTPRAAAVEQTPSQQARAVSPEQTSVSLPYSRKRSRIMSTAFDNGVLPAPLPIPDGDRDQAAAILAKRVAAVDENSTAALLTALQLSGFDVFNQDGSMTLSGTGPSQGIAFPAWGVAAMAKLYGRGSSFRLDDLGRSMSTSLEGWLAIPVADRMLEAVRTKATQTNPTSRFWARFIVELGRQSPQPYDMLESNVKASQVVLDPVQMSMLLAPLFADLSTESGDATTIHAERMYSGRGTTVPFATILPTPVLSWLAPAESPNLPCFNSLFFKITGKLRDKIFESLLENVEKELNMDLNVLGLKGSEYRSAANALVTIIKFLLTYAALDARITIDREPLIRTTGIDLPGDPDNTRTLSVHLEFTTGHWDLLDCLDPIVKLLTGLKVQNLIPKHGPIGGAGIEWKLEEGGFNPHAAAQGQTKQDAQIVLLDFSQDVSKLPIECAGQVVKSSQVDQFTNKEGNDCIHVVGAPQSRDLAEEPVTPVMKEFSVYVNVAVKHDENPWTTFGGLIGTGTSSFQGKDALSLAATFLTETLYRSRWWGSDTYSFPVKDWDIAKSGWYGEMTTSYHFFSQPPTHTESHPSHLMSHSVRTHYDITDSQTDVSVVGGESLTAEGGNVAKGHFTFQYQSATGDYLDAEQEETCHGTSYRIITTRSHEITTEHLVNPPSNIGEVVVTLPPDYSKLFGQNASSQWGSQPQEYTIEARFKDKIYFSKQTAGYNNVDPGCGQPVQNTPIWSSGFDENAVGFSQGISVTGTLDNNDRNHLHGHQESRPLDNVVMTTDWDLTRKTEGPK